MKLRHILSFTLLGLLSLSASAETTVKILHLQKIPKILAIWQGAAQEYEKAHPGVKIEFDYLENEAFKAKLPTLATIQRSAELVSQLGRRRDVRTDNLRRLCRISRVRSQKAGSKTRFTLPVFKISPIRGKRMVCRTTSARLFSGTIKSCAKRRVLTRQRSRTWDDFIDAVKKCQAAGITPLAAGGKDKWPLHFYPALLMMRIMGKEGMQAAIR